MKTYKPEKLTTWDRLFNRYKTIPVEEGEETWAKVYSCLGTKIPDSEFKRDYVIYHVIDRLTGAYTIKKEYLTK